MWWQNVATTVLYSGRDHFPVSLQQYLFIGDQRYLLNRVLGLDFLSDSPGVKDVPRDSRANSEGTAALSKQLREG